MPFYAQHVRDALAHLKRNDQVMRNLIRDIGPFTLKTQKPPFQLLIHSIISQQISTSAAATIIERLLNRVGNPVLPDTLSQLSLDDLRALGISRQKATYCLDLTHRVLQGQVHLEHFSRRSDEEIIEELIQVRGIGTWTAQMFLIFGLGRMDVLPAGDLGIRNSVQAAYALKALPTERTLQDIAKPWRPYATIASWYLWRFMDTNKRSSPTKPD